MSSNASSPPAVPARRALRRARGRLLPWLLIGLLIGLAATTAPAAAGGHALTGAFANLEPGGRGAALGGALMPLVDDATALHWNAARLVTLEQRAVAATYADLYGLGLVHHTAVFFAWPRARRDLHWEAPHFARRTGAVHSAWALGVQATQIDLDPETYAEYDLSLAHARRGWQGLAYAVTAHLLLVRSDLDDVAANGFAGDLALNRPFGERLTLALVWRAIFSTLDWDGGTSEALPSLVQLGGAFAPGAGLRLPVTLTYNLTVQAWEELAGAAEWRPRGGPLTLRAGLRARDDGDETVLLGGGGAGLRWREIDVDYGFALGRDELGDTHRISLHVRF